jgi:hypothetical protein
MTINYSVGYHRLYDKPYIFDKLRRRFSVTETSAVTLLALIRVVLGSNLARDIKKQLFVNIPLDVKKNYEHVLDL